MVLPVDVGSGAGGCAEELLATWPGQSAPSFSNLWNRGFMVVGPGDGCFGGELVEISRKGELGVELSESGVGCMVVLRVMSGLMFFWSGLSSMCLLLACRAI